MPTGIEQYRGYSILWETKDSDSETRTWQAQAAMVAPANESGIPETISGIQGDHFKSELEAREYVLRAARQKVDDRLA